MAATGGDVRAPHSGEACDHHHRIGKERRERRGWRRRDAAGLDHTGETIMPDAPGLTATEYAFRHPHGSFPVRCHQLTGENLAHQLLGAEESYITVAAERLVEDALPLVLRLVDLGERLTNGIATLSQLQRESMRLELCRVHDSLLERGYGVLVGVMDRAVIREGEIRRWIGYARVIGVVIHDTGEVAATIVLPEGEVLERDEDIAPARAVPIAAYPMTAGPMAA
jgi:hypothetical protein